MTNAALILKDSPVTAEIAPCEKCHYEEEDDIFAYARADSKFLFDPGHVLAGCINCGNIFVVGAQFDDVTWDLLPLSSLADFTNAVGTITRLREWVTPYDVAALMEIHLGKQSCAFCIHRPGEDPDGCWCPLCIETDDPESPFASIDEYDAYTRSCLMHGMAHPHTETYTFPCVVCSADDGS